MPRTRCRRNSSGAAALSRLRRRVTRPARRVLARREEARGVAGRSCWGDSPSCACAPRGAMRPPTQDGRARAVSIRPHLAFAVRTLEAGGGEQIMPCTPTPDRRHQEAAGRRGPVASPSACHVPHRVPVTIAAYDRRCYAVCNLRCRGRDRGLDRGREWKSERRRDKRCEGGREWGRDSRRDKKCERG